MTNNYWIGVYRYSDGGNANMSVFCADGTPCADPPIWCCAGVEPNGGFCNRISNGNGLWDDKGCHDAAYPFVCKTVDTGVFRYDNRQRRLLTDHFTNMF